MTGIAPILALLQEAATGEAEATGLVVAGWAVTACGAADLLVALLLLLMERPPDPRQRTLVIGALAASGLAMVVVGTLLLLGVIG